MHEQHPPFSTERMTQIRTNRYPSLCPGQSAPVAPQMWNTRNTTGVQYSQSSSWWDAKEGVGSHPCQWMPINQMLQRKTFRILKAPIPYTATPSLSRYSTRVDSKWQKCFSNLLSMKKGSTPNLTPPSSPRLEAEWQLIWKRAEMERWVYISPVRSNSKHFAPR